MKYRKITFYVMGLFLFLAGSFLFAQSGTDRDAKKREIVVILDVSGSMNDNNKFNNVKNYLDKEVADSLLKNGDDFTMVLFGTTARELYTKTINNDADRTALKAELAKMEPSDNYTDIGTAMEKAAEIIERPEKADTRRIVLFITDGLNVPPPGSKYRGVDISVDERFKSLGERISQGAWFLYVIGIGGNTAAGDVAALIPGSELLNTDSTLSGVDFNSQIAKQEEEEERAKEEEARRLEEQQKQEEEHNTSFMGFMAFLRRLADSLSIPLPALIAGFFVILLLLILLIVFIIRAFKVRELVVTDESETIIRKVPPFGGFTLNSPSTILPGLGNENNQVLRISRSLAKFTVQTMDSQAIAETSPYKKQGSHPLKGVISLANGRLVRITIR